MKRRHAPALCACLVVSVLATNVTVYLGIEVVLEFPAGSCSLSLETFFGQLSRPDACIVPATLEDSVAGSVLCRYRRFLHESRGVLEVTGDASSGPSALWDRDGARCPRVFVLAFEDSAGSYVDSAALLSRYRRKEVVLVMAGGGDEGAVLEAFRAFYDSGFLRFAVVTWSAADADRQRPARKSISGAVAVKEFNERTLHVRGVEMAARLVDATKLTTGFRVGVLIAAPVFFVTGRTQVFPPHTGYSAKIFSFLAAEVLEAGGLPRQMNLTDGVVELVYAAVEDDYCFAVARAKPLPPEKVLLATVHESLAVALVVTLAASTAGLFLSQLLALPRVAKVALVADAATVVFRAFVTGTLERRTGWSSAGVFSLSLVFLNIVTTSVVHCSVFSLYSPPRKPSEIDTVEELLEYSESIYTLQYFADFFGSLGGRHRILRDVVAKVKTFNQSTFDDAVDRLVSQRTSMFMTRNFFRGLQRLRALIHDDDRQTVHVPKECLLAPVYLTFPVSRRLASFRLDRKLVRAEAAGLVAKWMADSWFEPETQGVYLPPEPQRRRSTPRPLVLRHVDPAVKALLCGLSVAAVVFVAEVLTRKWRFWMQALRRTGGQRLTTAADIPKIGFVADKISYYKSI